MEKELKSRMIVTDWLNDVKKKNHMNISGSLKLERFIYRFCSSEYNKPLYLVYNGKLRQFRLKKTYIFPFNYTYKCDAHGCVRCVKKVEVIDIAGVGEVAVIAQMWGYAFEFEMFESVKDFKTKNPYVMKHFTINRDILRNLYSDICTITDEYTANLYRYFWNGTSAEIVKFDTNLCLFFCYDRENGYSLDKEFERFWKNYKPTYAQKEICEKENSIEVVCFSDEETDSKKEEEVVEFYVLGVKYTTTKEGIEKLRDFLDKMVAK